jgi:hypothetical protein
LSFAYGKINYSRWGAVHLEECKKLNETHANIHDEFMKGHFVVQQTQTDRNFSGVATQQEFEQMYKPAKGPTRIIAITC